VACLPVVEGGCLPHRPALGFTLNTFRPGRVSLDRVEELLSRTPRVSRIKPLPAAVAGAWHSKPVALTVRYDGPSARRSVDVKLQPCIPGELVGRGWAPVVRQTHLAGLGPHGGGARTGAGSSRGVDVTAWRSCPPRWCPGCPGGFICFTAPWPTPAFTAIQTRPGGGWNRWRGSAPGRRHPRLPGRLSALVGERGSPQRRQAQRAPRRAPESVDAPAAGARHALASVDKHVASI